MKWMDSMNKIIFMAVVFVTNAIQAITGFAGTLLAMPASIALIGVDEAKIILNFVALMTCIYISISNFKYVNFKVLGKIIVFMGIGMFLGIKLFEMIQLEFLLYGYGTLIIIIALKNLFIKSEIQLNNVLIIILLLVAGIVHGMFVSGGALLVVYVSYVLKDKAEFRATISTVWVILDGILFVNQIYNGHITGELMLLNVLSLIPAMIGVFVGNKLYKKISQKKFMELTYILLLLSGLSIFL